MLIDQWDYVYMDVLIHDVQRRRCAEFSNINFDPFGPPLKGNMRGHMRCQLGSKIQNDPISPPTCQIIPLVPRHKKM